MPLLPLPPEIVGFDVLVDEMSKRLSFDDKGKLGAFIRDIIQKALLYSESKTQEKVSFEQAVFCLAGSTRALGNMVELRVLAQGNGVVEPKKICSIGIKESEYMGSPDGSPKVSDPKDLPKSVRRKRINAVDVKLAKSNTWTNAGFVVGKGKKSRELLAHLDVQVDS